MSSEEESSRIGKCASTTSLIKLTVRPFSSPAESFSLEIQAAEENFDLALIASLEIDIVPHIGDARVPDPLVARLAKILQQGSKLYQLDEDRPRKERSIEALQSARSSRSINSDLTKVEDSEEYRIGKTESGTLVPRERFSYWCFDLLFLICANSTSGEQSTSEFEHC